MTPMTTPPMTPRYSVRWRPGRRSGWLALTALLVCPALAESQDCSGYPHYAGEWGVFADHDRRDGIRGWSGGARGRITESIAVHGRVGSITIPDLRESGRSGSARIELRLPIDRVHLCALAGVEGSTWEQRMFGVDVASRDLGFPLGAAIGTSHRVTLGRGATIHLSLEGGAQIYRRRAEGEDGGIRFYEEDPGTGSFLGARTTIAFRHYYLQAGVTRLEVGETRTALRFTVGHRFW